MSGDRDTLDVVDLAIEMRPALAEFPGPPPARLAAVIVAAVLALEVGPVELRAACMAAESSLARFAEQGRAVPPGRRH